MNQIAARIVEHKLRAKFAIKLALNSYEKRGAEWREMPKYPAGSVALQNAANHGKGPQLADNELPQETPAQRAEAAKEQLEWMGFPKQNYRGQTFGAKFVPHLSNYLKTYGQLHQEQGVGDGPRYSIMSSVPAAGTGAVGLLGSLPKYVFSQLERGVSHLSDSAGLTNDWNRGAHENAIIAGDMVNRGLHQLRHFRSSRAYDDQYGPRGALAAQLLKNDAKSYNSHAAKSEFVENFAGPTVGFLAGPAAVGSLGLPAGVAGVTAVAAGAAPAAADLALGLTGNGNPTQEQLFHAAQNPNNFSKIPDSDNWQVKIPGLGQIPLARLTPEDMQYVLQQRPEINEQILDANINDVPVNALSPHERINLIGTPTADEVTTSPPPAAGATQSPAPATPAGPSATDQVSRRPFEDDDSSTQQSSTPAPVNESSPSLSPAGNTQPDQPTIPAADRYIPDADEQTKAQLNEVEAQLKERAAADATVSEMAADPDGERAKQFRQQEAQPKHLDEASAAYAAENPPPTNPQDWGGWLQNMMNNVSTSWDNMTPEAQLAIGLGVPLGIIGLLSGNVGGFLLSAVGLGVAGVAAAQSGMFGDTAQNATTPAGETPAPANPKVDIAESEILNKLPANQQAIANSALNSTRQFKKKLYDAWRRADKDPSSMQFLEDVFAMPDAALVDIYNKLPAEETQNLSTQLQGALFMTSDEKIKAGLQRLINLFAQQKTSSCFSAAKIARCWKGYEPVPGKKPYSEDSCRPVGSKKKKKMKKKADDYLSFLASDKPAILTLIRGYYDKQTGPQSKKVSAQGNS